MRESLHRALYRLSMFLVREKYLDKTEMFVYLYKGVDNKSGPFLEKHYYRSPIKERENLILLGRVDILKGRKDDFFSIKTKTKYFLDKKMNNEYNKTSIVDDANIN